MLRRFLAASGTGAVLIAGAALIVFMVRPVALQRASLLLLLWCLAPAVWGLWAMAAPTRYLSLPLWGALLGLILSSLASLALNLPQRVFNVPVSLFVRLLVVGVVTCFYFVAWSVVHVVDEALQPQPMPMKPGHNDAKENIAAAHKLLVLLRGESGAHPQVEEAIRRLELALANLTVRTSGLL